MERRRAILIKRQFQLAFIARLVGLVALGGLLGGIVLYSVLGLQLRTYSGQLSQLAPETQGKLLISIALVNGLVILMVSGAAAWVTVFTLHRVAGPLARLEQVVRAVGEGDLDIRTTLRERDELQEFPAALAKMVTLLTQRVLRLQRAHAAVRREVDALAAEKANPTRLEALRRELDEAEAVAAEFRISPTEPSEPRT